MHYNVQSIVPKLDILQTELNSFGILAFSETWLHATVDSNELIFPLFQVPERKDRPHDRYGGVMIYVKEGLDYRRRHDLEPRGIECIWIELSSKHKHILFGLFYRPPSSDANYFSMMLDSLNLATDTGLNDIIVTGDFNLNALALPASRKITSLCSEFALCQCINEPTHFTETSESLIDLLFVHNKNSLILSGVGDPFLGQEHRYHCPIYGAFKFCRPKIKSFTRQIWNYDRGDYNLLRTKAADTDWNTLRNDDVDVYASNIINHLLSIAKDCIPNKMTRIKPTDPPWITSEIKRTIRKRKRAYRKAKQTNSPAHWSKFKRLRNKSVSLIRNSKLAHTAKIAEKLRSDSLSSKNWWSILKSFISPASKTSLPPLEHNGSTYTDEQDKANLLNGFFRDQTMLNDQNVELPDIIPHNVTSPLRTLSLTPLEVESVLKTLELGKASGPDGLNNRILKELAQEISVALCALFNYSLSKGCFPAPWKDANLSPIPKKGDLSLLTNHRPISLLNSVSKLFERLVFKHLFNHLRDNNILTPLQSGFIPGDSTVNQLTYLYNTFCHALDNGKEVRVVFCDIKKAFDRVWHAGLLHKLRACGVSGSLLDWFRNYLSDRRQRVVLPGANSDWAYIRAGVPQGSVLGPLLFLIFINDIVIEINSNIRLFADDTSLYIIVENPQASALLLNTDLQKISDWADKWLVLFNPPKSESLTVSRKLIKPVHPPLSMNNQQIKEVQSHKHLGLYLASDGSWHDHIQYIKDKAWTRVNIMRNLKYKLDRKSLEIIYIAFIRPILEYGDTIWDNCAQYEKDELEKIQHEAARIATGATRLVSLQNLYNEVKWQSLQKRRDDHKLTLFFKMNNNLVPRYLSSLVPPTVGSASRYSLRNANNLQNINTRTTLYSNSFLPSAVRCWNDLPSEAKQTDSLYSFKHYLARDRVRTPKYYYTGKRPCQILHTRLRTDCSSLNFYLFSKHIIDSPLCSCGSIENAYHYLFQCDNYTNQRIVLFDSISQFHTINLDLLLFGDPALTPAENTHIFERVQKYIMDTKRF
ncbi:MAG: hypothetical protein JAZ17_24870 [Candidatus Thiodiazotropha endolucinida]|nr:hypothetical protein [Candidatus Thiodiazotropha endolucinida]